MLGEKRVYMNMTTNVESAILQGYPRSLLNQSSFGKQRIVAIKNPTTKYSSSDICRFLVPALWNTWQGCWKNTSVIQFMRRDYKRYIVWWETINRTNDPGGHPSVPDLI